MLVPKLAATPAPNRTPTTVPASAASARPARRPGWVASLVVAGVVLGIDLPLAVLRYRRFEAGGFDLGIFVQEVRGWAEHGWPVSDLIAAGYPTLGEHFSPVLALLAPAFGLWPSPILLLVAQSVLFAAATVPLTWWAARRLGPGLAIMVGLGFGLSTAMINAALFDVHEIMFAIPLLALSLSAVGHGRHRAGLAWALPLILVKEDLGLTLAAIACVVALRSRSDRRAAIGVGAVGVVATVVEMRVIIPLLNQTHQYRFTDALGSGLGAGWDVKALTVVLLLVPSLGLAVRSPLIIVALPTLAWRFSSPVATHWGPWFHYDAVPAVAITAALIDVLVRSPRLSQRRWRRAVIIVGVLATVAVLACGPAHGRLDPRGWPGSAAADASRTMLAELPSDAPVAAAGNLAPALASGHVVYALDDPTLRHVRPTYLAVDLRACPTHQACPILRTARELGYRPLRHGGFVELWRRG